MIRFIDLRGQGTGNRFAFWDTVGDQFLKFEGEQAWSTWGECADVVRTVDRANAAFLTRLCGLCPTWAFEPDDGTHEDRFWSPDQEEPRTCPRCTHSLAADDLCHSIGCVCTCQVYYRQSVR